jgi:AcrR family transcriptional regulator
VVVADPGAPIAAVADQAGVGISALYRRHASKGDLWAAFARFMRRVVDADTHSLTLRLAGTFTPTDDLNRQAATAQQLNRRLFERTKAAGAIRPDLVVDDQHRTRRLRHLALLLDASRTPGTALPGPPPAWTEISQRWETPRRGPP